MQNNIMQCRLVQTCIPSIKVYDTELQTVL